jgi:tetratricopeptide (TPR) repeat protein
VSILDAGAKIRGDMLPIVLIRRASVELEADRRDRAQADALQALALLQSAAPPGSFSAYVGKAYLNLGRAFQAQSKDHEARDAYRLAAENLEATLGPDHPDVGRARRAGLEEGHK